MTRLQARSSLYCPYIKHLPLLPVLFAGAGPLGAVDDLRHSGSDIGQGAVETDIHHAAAVRGVPRVVAVGPGQQVGHGTEEVVDGDADDHVVVDADVSGHHHHPIAHT